MGGNLSKHERDPSGFALRMTKPDLVKIYLGVAVGPSHTSTSFSMGSSSILSYDNMRIKW